MRWSHGVHLRPRVGGSLPITHGGVVRPVVLSPAVVPGEPLWWLARLLAPAWLARDAAATLAAP